MSKRRIEDDDDDDDDDVKAVVPKAVIAIDDDDEDGGAWLDSVDPSDKKAIEKNKKNAEAARKKGKSTKPKAVKRIVDSDDERCGKASQCTVQW
jgi:hypothetical protein